VKPASTTIRPEQLAREQPLRLAIGFDSGLVTAMILAALAGGSLTMLAESVRAGLMLGTEIFAYVALRRIHRGRLGGFEFGPGKIEQFANLTIAAGMLAAAGWIGVDALRLPFAARPPGSPAGLAAVAIVGALNTYFNWIAWLGVRRVTPPGAPVIMLAQLRARAVKLFSSCFVLLLLTLAAVVTDPDVVLATDMVGALFVTAVLIANAREMLRSGLPDLLDRSIDEVLQRPLNRALALHFDAYDHLGPVRTRRSGRTVFIEIGLGFAPGLSVDEVDRRVAGFKATVQREVAHAEVSVLVSAAPLVRAPAPCPPPAQDAGQ
jgi:divalent metal cation (Fe/Co/Zn/Cd) transporter